MSYASLTAGLWIAAIAVGIFFLLVNQICNRRIGKHLEEKNSRCHSISSMRTRTTSISSYYANLDLEKKVELQTAKKWSHAHQPFLTVVQEEPMIEDKTSLIPIIDPRGKDVTEKSKKIFVQRSDEVESIMSGLSKIRADFFMTSNFDPIGVYKHRTQFTLHFVAQCRAVLNETAIIENLRKEKFDVMIVENFDMCGVALSHLLQPRSLITSGAGYPFSYMLEEFGIPLALSYNPSSFMPHFDVHSMWSRLKNIYANWIMHYYFYPRRHLIEELYRERFGADFPSLEEISSHAAYTLTNSEPFIDYATPTLSRIISIPGIGAKQPKALDDSWNAILALRQKAILISFGSVAKSADLPSTLKNSIATVIGRFPDITFIWKYENPEDAFAKETKAALPNLHFTSWMPQNDLLNDDRIVVFVTHGGMGSTQETALRGKPGIFVPIFGDQPRNAGMMEHNGLGKVLDKFDLAYPDKVEAVIREVLTDNKYAEKSRRISAMLAKKPFTSREILVKTVEFAAEFGPSAALRPQSYDMNAIEYHNIDILAVSALVLVLLAYAAMRGVKWMVRRFITAQATLVKHKNE
ncbi:hypothetical protein PRIPAC_79460 [Pristionchus pacificus]|nr:hypothetical protein PRIPAC_79460 [Pristionchus pacificus]